MGALGPLPLQFPWSHSGPLLPHVVREDVEPSWVSS